MSSDAQIRFVFPITACYLIQIYSFFLIIQFILIYNGKKKRNKTTNVNTMFTLNKIFKEKHFGRYKKMLMFSQFLSIQFVSIKYSEI